MALAGRLRRCVPSWLDGLPRRAVPAGCPHHQPGDRAGPVRRVEGVRRGVAGRQPAGARRGRADGRVRGDDRPHQDRLGRDRLLDAQPGSPRQHLLHARRPGTRPDDLWPRRVVGPAGGEGRHRSGPSADGDARDRHRRAGAPQQRDRHDGRRVRASRRGRARLRVPGAPPEGRADLHRCHRPADDGADGRDRRRGGAQLPRVAELQRRRARGARPRRGEGRADDRRHRPPAARRVFGRRRPSGRARRCPPARHAVPRPAAAHHEGVGRAAGAARRDRQGAHLAGDARRGGRGEQAGARRHRADDHRVGDARRGAGQGRRVRRRRLHLPDPLSPRSPTSIT